MDYYKLSLNELRTKLRENQNLTQEEWDMYAHENQYFSSITIKAHMDVYSWDDVKKKIHSSFIEKILDKKIEKLRSKLNKSIEKNGLNSKETAQISGQIDIMINNYYKRKKKEMLKKRYYEERNKMGEDYKESYKKLKSLTFDLGRFPTVDVWNEYAKKSSSLNNVSMEYISGLNWHNLEKKVIDEIN